jgi:hypothetical protein
MGYICFDMKSFADITYLQVGYISIPRVEYTGDAIDLVVENLTLSGCNLFPNVVSIEAYNFIKFSPYSAITDEHHPYLWADAGRHAGCCVLLQKEDWD